jgi:hypothetical protein
MTPSEVLARMLNSYSGQWEINDERIKAIFAVGGLAPEQHQAILLQMINEAKQGSTVWEVVADRILAVKACLIGARRPTADGLRKVAQQVRTGAAVDGMSDRAWVEAAIRALETLANLMP